MGIDKSYWDTETVMIPFLRYPPAYKKNTVLYEKKAETISKLLENWLKLIIIFVFAVHIFSTGMDGVRDYFLHARTYRLRVPRRLIWKVRTISHTDALWLIV